MNIRNEIGSKIEQLRESKGLTQGELAEKARLGRNTVVNLEAGRFDVKIGTLEKIASSCDSVLEINFKAE